MEISNDDVPRADGVVLLVDTIMLLGLPACGGFTLSFPSAIRGWGEVVVVVGKLGGETSDGDFLCNFER